ncbi:hypothetical protein MAR_028403 [Mya arenaria]|uniref:GST N-terminal domain-containing protein n=1 Tax=Mya arenaria TaxID=6604 RepID=A0ABY7DI07_MYAAR|nr:hypothetical protein MAR_028403 [Mya arenaria]
MVPCLEVNGGDIYHGTTIVESGAICLYLAELYGKLGPEQDKEAHYNSILYTCTTLDAILVVLLMQLKLAKGRKSRLVKKMLTKFTAADCVLGYSVWWALLYKEGALLKDYLYILRYYENLR